MVINRTCIFCDEYNSLFNENHLEEHYWRDCPMLAHCPLCYQVIEIPNLTFHMVNECENRSVVSACPRCHEAVLASEFRSHVSRRSCRPYPVDPNASRCPICHLDVPGGEKGWRLHLLAGDGCPQSDRKPRVAFGDHEIETD
ncbi:hypothetical protein BJ742DRAFT_565355 [Cladochytrium replicatum]|nr:hypothetical protein BJ742DRAFT_565355 [Cladochytrium replicatum]